MSSHTPADNCPHVLLGVTATFLYGMPNNFPSSPRGRRNFEEKEDYGFSMPHVAYEVGICAHPCIISLGNYLTGSDVP
jgi:hypothetical protein